MTTKYLHQANADAPVVEFSDRPFKASCITIKPRWPISADYRKDVQKTYSSHRRSMGAIPLT